MKRTLIFTAASIVSVNLAPPAVGQTLYTPGGTVTPSSNGFVGVGTSTPDSNLTVIGDLHLQRSGGSSFYVQTPSTDVRVFSWGNFPLMFGANGNVSELVLTTSGNIGIGNSAPTAKLDINEGSAAVGVRVTTASDANVRLNDGTSDVAEFRNVGTSSTRLVTLAARPLILGTLAAQPIIISTSNVEAMRVDVTGNVGIGTSSPGMKLDVRQTGSGPNNYGIYAYANGAGTNNYAAYFDAGGATNNYALYTNIGNVVLAATTGNVGIGTSNPTQKLSVNGTVRAKEIVVDTAWSDYVFEEGYRLAPLSEVEAHIKSQKHLDGVPSAREVAEGGIRVGDIEAKLLAKIEELTLHQIAQEKRLMSQQAELNSLKAENATMKEQMAAFKLGK